MKKDKEDEYGIDELYELYETNDFLVPLQNQPIGKKRHVLIPLFFLLIILLMYILSKNITIRELLHIENTKDDLNNISLSSLHNSKGIDDYTYLDIDYRLQQGELLSDIVKDYFIKEYGLEVAVIDTVDIKEGINDGEIVKRVTVKELNGNSVYEFNYSKDTTNTSITDTYGSALTSKLLGTKLTEYYKDKLPDGSLIWVNSDNLGLHTKVGNEQILNVVVNSTIDELLGYTDEVNLFNSICITIVEDIKTDNKYEIEDYTKEYKDLLLDIATTFEKKDAKYMDLEVGFLKGEEGKLNVLSYIEHKMGVVTNTNTKQGNYFIDWYKEIPLMGDEAKDNIIGAMSIKRNPKDVLTNYYTKGETSYLSADGSAYISVCDTVWGIMDDSISTEKRSLENVSK